MEPTVQTDRTVANNKQDIIMCDNDKGTCMLIDVVICGDRNVTKKEAEKIQKQKLYNDSTAYVECKNISETSK